MCKHAQQPWFWFSLRHDQFVAKTGTARVR
jgi:hypothetical protein